MSEENTPTSELIGIVEGKNIETVELGAVSAATAYSPQTRDDPKEPTRQFIVYCLLAIMAGLLLLPFVMTAFFGCKDTAKECKDIMTKELWEFVHIAFPALTGLLGTAIGFYFERNSK